MRVSRARFVAVTMAMAIGGAACSADRSGPEEGTTVEADTTAGSPGSSRDAADARATPGAVAAAVLSHLDRAGVGRVAASDDGGVLQASVSIDHPQVASVFVSIHSWSSGLSRCGLDHGYAELSCVEGRELAEVVVREDPRPRMPVYMGRARSKARGSVLVQVFGQRSPAARALVEALVADPLIGLSTSSDLIAEGDAIPDLEDLEIEVRMY